MIDYTFYAYRVDNYGDSIGRSGPHTVRAESFEKACAEVPEPSSDSTYVEDCGERIVYALDESKLLRVNKAMQDLHAEVESARSKHAAYNSAHEGWAVIKEKLDELWDHVKMCGENHDIDAMRKEALQVAATAMRFVTDVCDGDKGRR